MPHTRTNQPVQDPSNTDLEFNSGWVAVMVLL